MAGDGDGNVCEAVPITEVMSSIPVVGMAYVLCILVVSEIKIY